jgi:hypothetical protein
MAAKFPPANRWPATPAASAAARSLVLAPIRKLVSRSTSQQWKEVEDHTRLGRAPVAKGLSGNKRTIWRVGIGRNGVVPFTVEIGTFDVEGGHFGVGDDNALGYWPVSSSQRTVTPVLVMVAENIGNAAVADPWWRRAPGRRIRADGWSCANSAKPVAVATAAMPP